MHKYVNGKRIDFTQEEIVARQQEEQTNLTQRVKDDILRQIQEIEILITPRRVREAILSSDTAWINTKEEEIVALRLQL